MSLMLAPTLSTPLLKIPLLISHAVCTFHGMTPPRLPPPTEEQKKFAIPDYMTRTTAIQMAVTAATKWALCGIAVAEAVTLFAQLSPSSTSDRFLSILLPSNTRHPAALRMTPVSTIACLLGITGGLIRIWCHRTLGKFFTWQMAVRSDHQLVTSGPYSIIRHPSYIGWVLMVAGNFALLFSEGSYVNEAGLWEKVPWKIAGFAIIGYLTFVTGSLLCRIAKEDAVLRREFGVQWEEWARRTPYRLIPHVY